MLPRMRKRQGMGGVMESLLTFSWKSGQWDLIPVSVNQLIVRLLDVADFLEDGFHELTILSIDTLLEGSLYIRSKFIGATNSSFHSCCCARVIFY